MTKKATCSKLVSSHLREDSMARKPSTIKAERYREGLAATDGINTDEEGHGTKRAKRGVFGRDRYVLRAATPKADSLSYLRRRLLELGGRGSF